MTSDAALFETSKKTLLAPSTSTEPVRSVLSSARSSSTTSSSNLESIKIADDLLSSSACSSVFDVFSEEVSQDELLKLLNSEDLLFCGNSAGTKGAKKDQKKRRSVRRSVRRSARFQPKNEGSEAGSFFAIEEIEFDTKRRRGKSSKKAIVGLMCLVKR